LQLDPDDETGKGEQGGDAGGIRPPVDCASVRALTLDCDAEQQDRDEARPEEQHCRRDVRREVVYREDADAGCRNG
jgi:hypothetical protein